MARKFSVVLLGCWALVMSAAVIFLTLHVQTLIRQIADQELRIARQGEIVMTQTEIIAVNTVMLKALVEKIRARQQPEMVSSPGLKLELGSFSPLEMKLSKKGER